MTDTVITKYDELKQMALENKDTLERFANALGGSEKRARAFLSSVLTVVRGENSLLKCEPAALLTECMKAAVLDLPINKELGLACIVPFSGKPHFLPMKNGYIQLAHRTKQYLVIHTGEIYEGQIIERDQLTGKITIKGKADESKPVTHYFNYFKMINGFESYLCMSIDELKAWGKKYNPNSYDNKDSLWQKNPPAMYRAKVTKLNLKWNGMLSISIADEEDEYLDPAGMTPQEFEDQQGEIVDSQFVDVDEQEETDPQPSEETPSEPEPIVPDEPLNYVALIVESRMVQNTKEAQYWLPFMNPLLKTEGEVMTWAKCVRGWLDTGLKIGEAAEKANAGEMPK